MKKAMKNKGTQPPSPNDAAKKETQAKKRQGTMGVCIGRSTGVVFVAKY